MSKTTAEILRAAEIVLRERGRTQGFLQDIEGRVCLIGALHIAGGSDHAVDAPREPRDWLAYREACRALALHLGLSSTLGTDNLITWNDTPGRRDTEVRAALLAAADEIEGKCEFCHKPRCAECEACPLCSGDGHAEGCSHEGEEYAGRGAGA